MTLMMLAVAALSAPADAFEKAAGSFSGCLKATVQMGMMTKMDPAQFKDGFAKSCMAEESIFRAEAVKFAMTQGRSEAEAQIEVGNNIANARRIFAADQESYIRTGKVPR